MRLKVEGHSDLVRDTDSLAVINSNINEFANYKKRKDAIKKQIESSNRVAVLEETVSELMRIIEEMRNK